jgi:hypothetical protein
MALSVDILSKLIYLAWHLLLTTNIEAQEAQEEHDEKILHFFSKNK